MCERLLTGSGLLPAKLCGVGKCDDGRKVRTRKMTAGIIFFFLASYVFGSGVMLWLLLNVKVYLDELAEDFKEPCGVLDVFDDFHRADHVKLMSLFQQLLYTQHFTNHKQKVSKTKPFPSCRTIHTTMSS